MTQEPVTTPVHLNLNLVVKHEDHRAVGLHADHIDCVSYTSNNSGQDSSKPSPNFAATPSPNPVDYRPSLQTSKPKLEKVFILKDEVPALTRKGSYGKAYNLMASKYKLKSQLREATFLVRFHVCCMKTSHFDEATAVCVDLANLIIKHVDAGPLETKAFAERLANQGDNFEALLFYRIAATLYEHTEPDPEKMSNGISGCVLGMRSACAQLVTGSKSKYAQQLQCHVIPVMRDLRGRISLLQSKDRKFLVMREVWCYFNVAHVEGLVGDRECEEESLKAAIWLLEQEFGKSAEERRVYGMCLHNLAVTYYNTSRFAEASQTFKDAAAVKEKAEDYHCDEDKDASVQLSRRSNSVLFRMRKRATSLSNH